METYFKDSRKCAEAVLLPIREAYEWKQKLCRAYISSAPFSCFQFVKRMNGNEKQTGSQGLHRRFLLPIREAYEWKLFPIRKGQLLRLFCACFQFVKRMNGNRPKTGDIFTQAWASCFQFVKRMNGNGVVRNPFWNMKYPCFQFVKRMNGNRHYRREKW